MFPSSPPRSPREAFSSLAAAARRTIIAAGAPSPSQIQHPPEDVTSHRMHAPQRSVHRAYELIVPVREPEPQARPPRLGLKNLIQRLEDWTLGGPPRGRNGDSLRRSQISPSKHELSCESIQEPQWTHRSPPASASTSSSRTVGRSSQSSTSTLEPIKLYKGEPGYTSANLGFFAEPEKKISEKQTGASKPGRENLPPSKIVWVFIPVVFLICFTILCRRYYFSCEWRMSNLDYILTDFPKYIETRAYYGLWEEYKIKIFEDNVEQQCQEILDRLDNLTQSQYEPSSKDERAQINQWIQIWPHLEAGYHKRQPWMGWDEWSQRRSEISDACSAIGNRERFQKWTLCRELDDFILRCSLSYALDISAGWLLCSFVTVYFKSPAPRRKSRDRFLKRLGITTLCLLGLVIVHIIQEIMLVVLVERHIGDNAWLDLDVNHLKVVGMFPFGWNFSVKQACKRVARLHPDKVLPRLRQRKISVTAQELNKINEIFGKMATSCRALKEHDRFRIWRRYTIINNVGRVVELIGGLTLLRFLKKWYPES